ncbi:centromere protein W [Phyllopteryx taeniolatus]|uniref:centromere protein W n=1 Tax=Phycodurus eques TaxID=693459 RepID=UPI002ACDD8DD|nr:centromere protein W [Phycodurus eques]XP_061609575.1 centromere protein W [Phyllopteryx taeniolatus]
MLNKAPRLKQRVKSKTKGNVNVRPASEAMMELVTLLFLNNLAQQATAKAFEEKSSTIRAHHVKAVAKRVLKSARG